METQRDAGKPSLGSRLSSLAVRARGRASAFISGLCEGRALPGLELKLKSGAGLRLDPSTHGALSSPAGLSKWPQRRQGPSVGFESRTPSLARFSRELRALGAGGRESRACPRCSSLARLLRGPGNCCCLARQEGWRGESCPCPAVLPGLCSWAGGQGDPGQKQEMLHGQVDGL